MKDKEFEEEWKRYCDAQGEGRFVSVNVKDVARHFARWQKEQMMKDAVETTMIEGSLDNPTFVRRKIIIVKED